MRYDAFISYSHSADGRLAPSLQHGIQRFAKPWWKRRALAVFRDQTGLSAAPHLWASITEAMDESKWFVLLASPSAAASEWVGKEIEHWKANGDPERMLVVVTEGTWKWDDAIGEIDFAKSSSAHPALAGTFVAEPRHVDVSWARTEDHLDLSNGRFRDAIADLAAPLHGVAKDEIAGADVREHRKTVRTAWSAAAALALVTVFAVTASVLAVGQRNEARTQRIAATHQSNLAKALGASALAASSAPARLDRSLLYGAYATSHETTVDTEYGLLTALEGATHLVGFHHDIGGASAMDLDPDRSVLATVHQDGTISTWSPSTWTRQRTGQADGVENPSWVRFRADGTLVLVGSDRSSRLYDATTLEPRSDVFGTPSDPADVSNVEVSPDGSRYGMSVWGGDRLEIRDVATDSTVITIPQPCVNGILGWDFSPDGTTVGLGCERNAEGAPTFSIYDVAGGRPVRGVGGFSVRAVRFSGDGTLVATLTTANEVRVFDTETLTPVGPTLVTSGTRVADAAFAPGNRAIVTGSDDGALQAFDLRGGFLLSEARGLGDVAGSVVVEPGVDPFVDEAFAGPLNVIAASESSVAEWNLGRSTSLGSVRSFEFGVGALDPAHSRVFSERFTADNRSEMVIRSTATGATDRAFELTGHPSTFAVNPAGTQMFVATEPPQLLSDRGDLVRELESAGAVDGAPFVPFVVRFDAAGDRILATDQQQRLVIWDATSGKIAVQGTPSSGVRSIAWIGDGDQIVTSGNGGEVGFLRSSDLEPVGTFRGSAGFSVSDLSYSEQLDAVVITIEDGQVVLVDSNTRRAVGAPFDADGTQFRFSAVSPDGRTLATLSQDDAVRLWDVGTRSPLGPPLDLPFSSTDVAIAFEDPTTFVAWTGLGTLTRWDLRLSALRNTACQLADRPLTQQEWSRIAGTAPAEPAC